MKSLKDVDFEMRAPLPSNIELQFCFKSTTAALIYQPYWDSVGRFVHTDTIFNSVEKIENN